MQGSAYQIEGPHEVSRGDVLALQADADNPDDSDDEVEGVPPAGKVAPNAQPDDLQQGLKRKQNGESLRIPGNKISNQTFRWDSSS